MSNLVTATIVFSFRGKTHKPSLQLDLDQYMQQSGRIPELCPLIARANNFDLYSYEFEMMEAEPIEFSHAEGLVENFITEGVLDIKAFETAWAEQALMHDLEIIAERHLNTGDLTNNPGLKTALLEAYKLGKTRALNTK